MHHATTQYQRWCKKYTFIESVPKRKSYMNPDDLFKYFVLAQQLNTFFHSELVNFPARFRGNFKSISLISLREGSQQLGLPSLNYNKLKKVEDVNILQLLKKLEEEKAEGKGRDTAEKDVQSFITKTAMLNKGQMPFDPSINFITDEFSRDRKQKIDLVGWNTQNNAIVVIELKSDRLRQDLTTQLEEAEDLMSLHKELFQALFQKLKLHWDTSLPVEKVAIWPYESSPRAQKFKESITAYGYLPDGKGGYTFTLN